MTLNLATHVALDTETTGWSPKIGDRVIEVAAARFDPRTGIVSDTFRELLNPGRPISAQARAVHGITDEALAGAPRFSEIAERLTHFVQGAHVVIHNAHFDCGFLNAEYKRLGGAPFEKLPQTIICSKSLARRVLPRQSATLNAICDHFGIDRSERTLHGALIDCRLLASVYPHLAALQEARAKKLAHLLAMDPNELEPDVDALGLAFVSIGALMKDLEHEQNRIKSRLSAALHGRDYDHADFRVRFEERIRTNWKQVVRRHLQGINLAPFRKRSPTLTIQAT